MNSQKIVYAEVRKVVDDPIAVWTAIQEFENEEAHIIDIQYGIDELEYREANEEDGLTDGEQQLLELLREASKRDPDAFEVNLY